MAAPLLYKTYSLTLPKSIYIPKKYIPNTTESILWSSDVKVPANPQIGFIYRVREDYYQVQELYKDTDVHLPPMDLIGTDIKILDVEGDYVIIRNPVDNKVTKLYFKFLRYLNNSDIFLPSSKSFKLSIGSLLTSLERKEGIRFTLKLINNKWQVSIPIKQSELPNNRFKRTFDYESLNEAVFESLTQLLERSGFLNASELELYNAIATGSLKKHPFVESVLDSYNTF